MHKIALFCKSYDKDMLSAKRLVDSVMRYNCDKIPLYLSVPAKDISSFEKCLSDLPCKLLTDEHILQKSHKIYGNLPALFPDHLIQQLVKLEFWRLNLCENYAWIDSDSYFIRDFHRSDFMFDNDTPYTIQDEYHPEKELARMAQARVPKKVREKRVQQNVALAQKFRDLFGNAGPLYLFSGTMPYIWSVQVLRSLSEEYLQNRKITIHEMLYNYPCETQLYSEYLIYSKVIPLYPRPCMFKCFLYAEDFYLSQMKGENEYSLAKDYFGICVQSNWALIREKKNPMTRLKNHFKEYLRAIGLLSFKK